VTSLKSSAPPDGFGGGGWGVDSGLWVAWRACRNSVCCLSVISVVCRPEAIEMPIDTLQDVSSAFKAGAGHLQVGQHIAQSVSSGRGSCLHKRQPANNRQYRPLSGADPRHHGAKVWRGSTAPLAKTRCGPWSAVCGRGATQSVFGSAGSPASRGNRICSASLGVVGPSPVIRRLCLPNVQSALRRAKGLVPSGWGLLRPARI
jgi:hypothetical protein